MKKITFLLLLILPIFGFGQNFAINPTFVDAADWTDANAGTGQGLVLPADTHTADGSSSYKIVSNGTANSQVRNSNISGLTAGDYLFGYWVKGTSGVNTRPQVRDNGTSSNINGTNYTIVTTDTWEYVEQTFTVSGTGTISLRLFIKNSVADTAIQVDDASFTLVPPTGEVLTVNVVGAGSVTKSPDESSYVTNTVVALEAIPSAHWDFDSWSGDLTGSTNPDNISMSADKTVTATFVVEPSFDYGFLFNADGELEGWETDPQLSVASHTGGQVTLTPTTDQWARFSLFDFPIPTASYNKVTITLKNESTNDDQLGFIIVNGTTEAVTQSMTTSDAGFQSYVFDVTQFTNWTGDIESVRIRFTDADNPTSGRSSGTGNIIIDDIIFEFDASLSIKDYNKVDFVMYPNPSNNVVYLKSAEVISKVTVFDITGKQVLEASKLTNNELNISTLRSGLYMLQVEDTNQSKGIKKLIVN